MSMSKVGKRQKKHQVQADQKFLFCTGKPTQEELEHLLLIGHATEDPETGEFRDISTDEEDELLESLENLGCGTSLPKKLVEAPLTPAGDNQFTADDLSPICSTPPSFIPEPPGSLNYSIAHVPWRTSSEMPPIPLDALNPSDASSTLKEKAPKTSTLKRRNAKKKRERKVPSVCSRYTSTDE